jgi:hypothetical protein
LDQSTVLNVCKKKSEGFLMQIGCSTIFILKMQQTSEKRIGYLKFVSKLSLQMPKMTTLILLFYQNNQHGLL